MWDSYSERRPAADDAFRLTMYQRVVHHVGKDKVKLCEANTLNRSKAVPLWLSVARCGLCSPDTTSLFKRCDYLQTLQLRT